MKQYEKIYNKVMEELIFVKKNICLTLNTTYVKHSKNKIRIINKYQCPYVF